MANEANPICLECSKEIAVGEGRRYIYPVPKEPLDLRDAGYAHVGCAAELLRKQIDMRLVTILPRNPLFVHSHA